MGPPSGPWVTTRGHVIRGAASSGQHLIIGIVDISTALPSRTTSWHGAERTLFGPRVSIFPKKGMLFTVSHKPSGGSGRWR